MNSKTRFIHGFVSGLWAGAVAATTMLVLRLWPGVPSLPELMEDPAVSVIPGPIFSLLLDLLRFNAKPLLFAGLLALQLVLAGLLGLALAPLVGRLRMPWPVIAFGVGAGLGLLSLPILVPLSGPAGLANRHATPLTYAGLLLIWLVFGFVYARVLSRLNGPVAARALPEQPATAPAIGGEPQAHASSVPLVLADRDALTRRAAAGAILASLAVVGAGSGLRSLLVARLTAGNGSASADPTRSTGGSNSTARETAPPGLGIPGLSSEVTPTRDFYVVSKNFIDPVVDKNAWKLEVTGLVERTLTLDLPAFSSLPAVTQYATLMCISNDIGGNLISNALWKGVPLRVLLQEAAASPNAVDVVFHGADGYSDSIPFAKAMEPRTLCCFEMNGEPLPDNHGAPLRMVIPGIYGMKNAKWVTRIEVVNYDFQGYWQQQGWDDAAPYQTFARIDLPSRFTKPLPPDQSTIIGGVAFAGDRGVKAVDVSVDGGKNWMPANLKPALGPLAWSLWSFDWRPLAAGTFNIQARATDGTGQTQESRLTDPYPSGATGYHSVVVQVTEP